MKLKGPCDRKRELINSETNEIVGRKNKTNTWEEMKMNNIERESDRE
jgi:hypothetical protein